MPYRHDIYEYGDEYITINHSRETHLQSGLIMVNRLSSTEIGFAPKPLRIPEGLVIARSLEDVAAPKEIAPSESVECELENFATLGAERIVQRAQRLGNVAMFNPNLDMIDQNPGISPAEKGQLRQLHIELFRTFGSQNAARGRDDSPEIGGYY